MEQNKIEKAIEAMIKSGRFSVYYALGSWRLTDGRKVITHPSLPKLMADLAPVAYRAS